MAGPFDDHLSGHRSASLFYILRRETFVGMFFRVERGLSSRSSGIWTALNRSVDEKKYTAHHPPPTTKRYALSARQSPKILKPTKYFKGNSFVKLEMISICRIFFAGISPQKNQNFPFFLEYPQKLIPQKMEISPFFWSTPRKFRTKIDFFLSTPNFFFIKFPPKNWNLTFSGVAKFPFFWVPPNFFDRIFQKKWNVTFFWVSFM